MGGSRLGHSKGFVETQARGEGPAYTLRSSHQHPLKYASKYSTPPILRKVIFMRCRWRVLLSCVKYVAPDHLAHMTQESKILRKKVN